MPSGGASGPQSWQQHPRALVRASALSAMPLMARYQIAAVPRAAREAEQQAGLVSLESLPPVLLNLKAQGRT